MPFVLKASPASDAVAVYSVESLASVDTAPLVDPYNNLTRLKFHSSFFYPYRVDQRSGTVTLPYTQTSSGTVTSKSNIPLFAHGQAGTPMVDGYLITPLGETVPIVGSTYLLDVSNWQSLALSGKTAGWTVQLGVDNTNVYLMQSHVDRPVPNPQSNRNYTWVVRVYNDVVTGPSSAGTGGPLVIGNASYVALGRGRFDSRRRYLRRVDSGGSPWPTGRTLRWYVITSGSAAFRRFEFEIAGYYRQYDTSTSGTGTFSQTFTAPFTRVTS